MIDPLSGGGGATGEHAAQPHAPRRRSVTGGHVTPPVECQNGTRSDGLFLFPSDFPQPFPDRGDFLCDRITVIFPCFVPGGFRPKIGQMWFLDAEGVMESFRHRAQLVEGSWSAKMRIEVHDPGTADPAKVRGMLSREAHLLGMEVLWFRLDASPAKWLQGFNVFGSSDVLWLAAELVNAGLARIGLGPGSGCRVLLRHGYFTRIDATWNFDLGDAVAAGSLVHQLARLATVFQRRAAAWESSLTFPGRKWGLSIYHKGPELKAHPVPVVIEGLQEVADRIVRFEVVSRSERLDELGLRRVSDWMRSSDSSHVLLHRLWWSVVSEVRFPMQSDVDLSLLSKGAARTFLAWKAGAALTQFVSRRTAFRHASEIKKAGGPDILKPRPSGDVVEFRRVLRPVPAAVPAQIYERLVMPRRVA